MTYDELLIEADSNGLTVKEAPLQASDGRITTVGRIVEQHSISDRKQEYAARLRAYDRRIGLSGIILGYRKHCHNLHELADCLEVSEEFLKEALECYREKYGCYTELDGYVIMFEPHLAVMEKI